MKVKRRARSGQPGKLGIIRLYGPDLEKLRDKCWERDRGICQKCGIALYRDSRFDGDPQAYHMAHIRNKRMYGDTLENVRALCGCCHTGDRAEHNCGGKPLPRKPSGSSQIPQEGPHLPQNDPGYPTLPPTG